MHRSSSTPHRSNHPLPSTSEPASAATDSASSRTSKAFVRSSRSFQPRGRAADDIDKTVLVKKNPTGVHDAKKDGGASTSSKPLSSTSTALVPAVPPNLNKNKNKNNMISSKTSNTKGNKTKKSNWLVPKTKPQEDESCSDLVPLVEAGEELSTTDLENMVREYYSEQQLQLIELQQELVKYKAKNDKQIETHLFDRFEGIRKHDVMTQFSCKWFSILVICHAIFYYLYYVVRQGSQENTNFDVDDDTLLPSRSPAADNILQVSIYAFLYLFVVLMDIFWLALFPDKVRCERNTAHSHVIVAAHRASDSLEEMLPTVLKTFSPNCVWVADNGYRDQEAEALCARLGVHYEYNEVGNKANALVVVARKIQRRYGSAVRNVVLLDDDTELADDFFIRHDILADPKVGGYCVGIAINRSPPVNIWEIAIDFEYRAISHAFGARATVATLPFCHGICAVYKLDLMIEMYSKNWSLPGGLPFGEDGYAGLDYRMDGYQLKQDNANVVLTYCPRRFFPPIFSNGRVQGYGASSLWKQRAARWFLSWPRQLPKEFWLVFTYRTGTWYGDIQYRIYFLWWLFLNCVSVGWIPYMFYVWIKRESWILVLMLKGLLTVTGILVATLRILAFPPKLRKGIHPLAPLFSPLLGVANSVLRFFGFLFSLYWFIPFFRVNELRVLRDDDDEEDNNDVEHQQDSTETEEPTETDDALEHDSSEGFEVIAARNPSQASSWVDLLNRNSALGGDDHDQVEMPSLTSYSSSNSTATTK